MSLQRPDRAFLCLQPFNLQMQKVQTNDGKPVTLTVAEGLEVTVISNEKTQWLMSTADVANGYGVSRQTIDSHKSNHNDEIRDGIHFMKAAEIFGSLEGGIQAHQIYWTKAGVVRLGFFIKSERAKMFRDWAEQIILSVTAPKVQLPAATRRNHNRLSKDRLVELLSLVALVDDKEVRTALVRKLMPDLSIPSIQLELPFGGKGGNLK